MLAGDLKLLDVRAARGRAQSGVVPVAVIGAGAWGKNLVATFHKLGALGGVAEACPALRAEVARRYPGLPVHADHRALLASPDVRAVAIATPVPTHFALAREALLAGKDVFVEKPIALATREARELATLAAARGRVLMVGHLLLYQPAVRWMAGQLAAGTLGRLYALHQERLNLGRARAVENALWSLGVHDVAVMLHLVGQAPEHVQAVGQRAIQPGVEDDVHLHLVFPGGVRGHLHTSWLWPEKRRRLTVVGERGMWVYDELAGTITWHHKGVTPQLANRDEGAEVVFNAVREPLELELRHFLARVRDRRAPLSDGPSATEVVRVLETASRLLAPPGGAAAASPPGPPDPAGPAAAAA